MARAAVRVLGGRGNRELELIEQLQTAAWSSLLQAGNVVKRRARQLAPPPGYPGDDPTKKPLRDTLVVRRREGRAMYAVVGPRLPEGAHGHLYVGPTQHHSHGKPTGEVIAHDDFIAEAATSTRDEQQTLMLEGLRSVR